MRLQMSWIMMNKYCNRAEYKPFWFCTNDITGKESDRAGWPRKVPIYTAKYTAKLPVRAPSNIAAAAMVLILYPDKTMESSLHSINTDCSLMDWPKEGYKGTQRSPGLARDQRQKRSQRLRRYQTVSVCWKVNFFYLQIHTRTTVKVGLFIVFGSQARNLAGLVMFVCTLLLYGWSSCKIGMPTLNW